MSDTGQVREAASGGMEVMDAELARLRGELEEARKTVEHLERRQAMDALLADAEAVDLEAARLLTEAAVAAMAEPDVKLAVEDLRRTKPYLFARRSGARVGDGGAGARGAGGCGGSGGACGDERGSEGFVAVFAVEAEALSRKRRREIWRSGDLAVW